MSVSELEFHELGWGSDLYLQTGAMMPEDGLQVLEDFDSIISARWVSRRSPTT